MISLIKGMNQQEFASRWERSREKMYRFAYCYVKNEHDALEILSEATCRALTSLHQLKEPDYFDSWMGQIIIRTALDYLKKQKHQVPVVNETVLTEENEPESFDSYQQSELRIDIYAALNLIEPQERSYLILKYFEEKSFQEIGIMMGIPEATVKTKVYRSLKKLRPYFEKAEGKV